MSGLGKRFVESGYEEPKPLIIVDNFPIIEHVVNLFDKNNDKYIFICNDLHLKETNMRQILSSIVPKSNIFEVPVTGRQGPVHAVSLIFDNIPDDEEIIVSYCDYGTQWNYKNFLEDNRKRDADGSIACYRGFHPHMLGTDNYAFLKEKELGSRWMDKIQEKQPFTDNRMDEYASNGTYYFKNGNIMKKYFQKLMDLEMKVKNEYYVSMVYNLLVEDGLKVNIFEIEKMLQWGTPYDLEIYNGWSKYFKNILNKQKDYVDKLETTTILPLAGHGSRFSKKRYVEPKPLINVNNLPMVVQAIRCLPQSKNNVFIALGEHLDKYPLENKIKKYYPDSFISRIDNVTEGQACTTEIGIKESNIDIEKPILITACDNGVYYDVQKYQKLVDDINNDIIVWSFRNEPTSRNNPDMYAWMTTDENDYVKHVSCKKFIKEIHNIKESHVIIGTMFFRKAKYFLDGLNKNYEENIRSNNEFYVDDVLNQNIKAGLKVKVFEVDNYICWGTPNDYETYIYWQEFFDKCNWHPYKKELDTTYEKKKYTIRKKCVMCNNILNDEYFKKNYNIPIACYSKDIYDKNDIIIPYNIFICSNCKTVQTKYLGNLNDIYKINHADSTGDIMKYLHLKILDLIKFYKDKININNIVEIGSSKGILSDLILDNKLVDKYYIIEPCYFGNYRDNKIIIPDFFENVEFNKYNNSNTLIISHVFEHFYYPTDILNIIENNINIENFILVWPDLEYYKDNKVYHVLNTEHTFYVDNDFIINIFNNFSFKLIKKEYYKNHSVIFIFKRNNNLKKNKIINLNYDINDYYNNLINLKYKINNFINNNKDKYICIWPCSVHTQFLLVFIPNLKIHFLLDNSINKINKYIYGYNLKCLNFEKIKDNDKYAIILNGGPFNDEVTKYIKNKNILILNNDS